MRVRRRSLLLSLLLLAFLLLDVVLLLRRSRYREEIARLREGMTELERARTDAILTADAERGTLMLEIMRRQAQGDDAVHLAVNIDSAYVALDRGPARLRTMPARVGEERRVGTPPDTLRVVAPRGLRVVERLLGPRDIWPLPAWLWQDRGLPVPTDRGGPGWTGARAIVTSGGTLIYALPESGPLADSSYVMPGAVRVAERDLRAIRESLNAGTRVYFY